MHRLTLSLAADDTGGLWGLDQRYPLILRLIDGQMRVVAQLQDGPLGYLPGTEHTEELRGPAVGRHIWVSAYHRPRLHRLDPGTGAARVLDLPAAFTRLAATAFGVAGLTYQRDGRLLLAEDNGSVQVLSIDDLAAGGAAAPPDRGGIRQEIAAAGDRLWLSDPAAMLLLELTVLPGRRPRLERRVSMRDVQLPPPGTGLRLVSPEAYRRMRSDPTWHTCEGLLASAAPPGVVLTVDQCPVFVPWGGEPVLLSERRDLTALAASGGDLWLADGTRDPLKGRKPNEHGWLLGDPTNEPTTDLVGLPLMAHGARSVERRVSLVGSVSDAVATAEALWLTGLVRSQQRQQLLRVDLADGSVGGVPVEQVDTDRWTAPAPVWPQLPPADYPEALRAAVADALEYGSTGFTTESVQLISTQIRDGQVEVRFTRHRRPEVLGLRIRPWDHGDTSVHTAQTQAGAVWMDLVEGIDASDPAGWVTQVEGDVTWVEDFFPRPHGGS